MIILQPWLSSFVVMIKTAKLFGQFNDEEALMLLQSVIDDVT